MFLAVTYDGTLTTNNIAFYTGSTSSGVMQLGLSVSSNAGILGDNSLPFQVAGTAQTTGDRTPLGYFDDIRIYEGVASAEFLEGVRLQNIPEPSSTALLLCGIAGAGLRRWRRTERSA